MFSGIVEGCKRVVAVEDDRGARTLRIDLEALSGALRPGDSVAIDGCCLTIERLDGAVATFRAIRETLEKTTLRAAATGGRVNVERSLRVGDQLGGHFVSGHVDGVGRIVERRDGPDQTWLVADLPAGLGGLVIQKGSIALDGVSLTVAAQDGDRVCVALIPYTLAHTSLRDKGVGALVNVECDMIGKWVRRLLPGASG